MGRSSTIRHGLVVRLAARGTLYTVPWWSIVVANWLAALLAGLYLIWRPGGLRQRFNPLALIEG